MSNTVYVYLDDPFLISSIFEQVAMAFSMEPEDIDSRATYSRNR